MKWKALILSSAISVLGILFPPDAYGQFIGYISPQTVSQRLLNGVTAPTTAIVPNLGQSIHSLTYQVSTPCTNSMSLTLRFEASNDGSIWFPISEDATDQNSGSFQGAGTQGGLTATGYYPVIRVNLARFACLSGQTPSIVVNYSGTSTSNPSATGPFYQATPLRKVILLNQPTTNAASQPSISTNVPNGMTGGVLFIACSNGTTGANVNCPATATITANFYTTFVGQLGSSGSLGFCGGQSFTPETDASLSTFTFPNCPALTILWTFSGAGTANINWSAFWQSNPVAVPTSQVDPCTSPATTKITAVKNITTATTTTLIQTGTPGMSSIYVCGMLITMVATGATTDTVQIVGGTGTNCTLPGNLTAVISSGALSAGAFEAAYGNGGASILFQGGAQGGVSVCAVSTVGTTPNIGITMTFIVQ